ncbi:MAG: TonB-dependent receptor plug domain-containing protein, partial [Gammaproteobacteria bacterium]|nr:TonB-dependent receptor plug domain-containing protein [Gammaproteobacteria bacterium]
MMQLSPARAPAALVAALLATAAVADDAIEEIVVTADFRERPASELPTSVTVLSGDEIRGAAQQHFEELVNIVPNLNWSGDGHRARYFQIRGIGELEQYEAAPNPSVGFLIDDIDFSGIGTVATLFDMESVEVLRGPQGSRYGASALAGLIYMRSRAPSAERDGRLRLSVGDDDSLSLGMAFGGALDASERVTFRVSGQRHASNGFRDNTWLDRDDTNGREETSLRARLRIEASD